MVLSLLYSVSQRLCWLLVYAVIYLRPKYFCIVYKRKGTFSNDFYKKCYCWIYFLMYGIPGIYIRAHISRCFELLFFPTQFYVETVRHLTHSTRNIVPFFKWSSRIISRSYIFSKCFEFFPTLFYVEMVRHLTHLKLLSET